MSGNPANHRLVAFIRDVLGCGCPDEVLADVTVEHRPRAFSGLPVRALVHVGGRLLIGIADREPLESAEDALAACVARGKRVRDEGGYNRFRLVIAADDSVTAEPVLRSMFDPLPFLDDRLHLHVVDAVLLPRVLI